MRADKSPLESQSCLSRMDRSMCPPIVARGGKIWVAGRWLSVTPAGRGSTRCIMVPRARLYLIHLALAAA